MGVLPVQKAIGMRPVNKNYKVYLRGRKINYLCRQVYTVCLKSYTDGAPK